MRPGTGPDPVELDVRAGRVWEALAIAAATLAPPDVSVAIAVAGVVLALAFVPARMRAEVRQ